MILTRKRNIFLLAAALLTLTLVLAGCGTGSTGSSEKPAADTSAKTVLKVGATPKPHAEILEYVKPLLAKENIDLQVVVFNDYVQPNLALDQGDIDANFFQHIPYLESFNKDHNLNLTYTAKVHIEPIGIYSAKVKNLNELKDGDSIAIPNDPSNAGRALALLEKAGLIKLKDGSGISATVQDIVENPKNLKINLLDAAQLPRVLQDPQVTAAVINTNYALEAGLNPVKDAIFLEDKDSPYTNILAVRQDKANDPALQKLAKVLNSPEVKKFIEDQYKGAVVPAF